MASRTIVRLLDDVERAEGHEVDAAQTVRFGLDGVEYEIDLTDQHAADLRGRFAPFVAAGRKVKPAVTSSRAQSSSQAATAPVASTVRAWANENGFRLPPRGRIPMGVIEAYAAAQKTPTLDRAHSVKGRPVSPVSLAPEFTGAA